MTRLVLIRHPRPEVPDGVCYGRSDLAVADSEVRSVAVALLREVPQGARIYSSPLQRCLLLAHELSRMLSCDSPLVDPRLAEMHFGAWEMQGWEAIARAEVEAWSADLIGYRPGGGETVLEMAQRVQAFLRELTNTGIPEAVVVCHAGTIRLLHALAAEHDTARAALCAACSRQALAYGGVSILDLNP